MLKKLLTIGVCALLAAVAAVPAQAVPTTPGWYVVSVCTVPNTRECPSGPNPIFLGPHSTHASCLTAWALWAQGPLNQPPRLLVSDCIQY